MFVLTTIPIPAVRLSSMLIADGLLLVAIHQEPTPIASVYHVLRNGATQKIVSSNPLGKDDSATVVLFEDGMLWLIVSESDLVVGSSGATSGVHVYDVQTDLRPLTGNSTTDPVAQARIDIVVRRQKALRTKLADASDTMQS